MRAKSLKDWIPLPITLLGDSTCWLCSEPAALSEIMARMTCLASEDRLQEDGQWICRGSFMRPSEHVDDDQTRPFRREGPKSELATRRSDSATPCSFPTLYPWYIRAISHAMDNPVRSKGTTTLATHEVDHNGVETCSNPTIASTDRSASIWSI